MKLLRLLVPPLAAALLAAPAAAQQGNQSNISGPNITDSGAASGSFLGGGVRAENEMFARMGERVVFRDGGIGCASREGARAYADSVRRAPLDEAQALVFAVMTSRQDDDPRTAELARRLTGPAGDFRVENTASALAQALEGLLEVPEGCPEDRDDYAEAPQWEEAIRAMNDLVELAPDDYFAPPPCELIAAHDALWSLVGRALDRRARR